MTQESSPESPTVQPPPRRRWRGDLVAYALLGLLVFGTVIGVVVRQRRAVVPVEAWKTELDEKGKLRPVAEVAQMTRAMKLVTAEVKTNVSATITDERWRGTATATVEAPVKYSFGVDLSKLEEGAFSYNFLTRDYVVTLPPPKMIAAEVDGAHPVREVIDVTGTRFKSMAGREQLVLAQKAVYEQAKRQTLPASRRQEIRDVTRQQVSRMLASVVQGKAGVRVRFEDE